MIQNRHLKTAFILSIGCLAFLVLMQLYPVRARANLVTLYVKPDGTGSICSQLEPCQLDSALSLSTGGETLILAGGSYTGTGLAVVVAIHDLILYGGWDGAPDGPVLREPSLHITVLDGQNARPVIRVTGAALVLEDLVIQGGNSPDGGAGVRAENATLTLRHNLITRNNSGHDGGGVFVNNGSAAIEGNIILDNHAQWAGGLRLINDAQVSLVGNRIQGNTAVWSGGGVYVECCGNSTTKIARNLIQGNDGGQRGGGVSIFDSHVIMENNILAYNHAEYGASVYLESFGPAPEATSLVLTNNTLTGDASSSEALYIGSNLTAQLVNNIFADHIVGIPIPPAGSTITANHNLFWNQSDPFTGTNALTANPLLDATLHLTSESPAVDAGADVDLVDDIDGNPRPLFGSYDIGADEFALRVYLPMALH